MSKEKYRSTFKVSESREDDDVLLLNAMWAAFYPEEQGARLARMSPEERFNFACVIGRARHLVEKSEARQRHSRLHNFIDDVINDHVTGKLRFLRNRFHF